MHLETRMLPSVKKFFPNENLLALDDDARCPIEKMSSQDIGLLNVARSRVGDTRMYLQQEGNLLKVLRRGLKLNDLSTF